MQSNTTMQHGDYSMGPFDYFTINRLCADWCKKSIEEQQAMCERKQKIDEQPTNKTARCFGKRINEKMCKL